jgi:hypothetical protein
MIIFLCSVMTTFIVFFSIVTCSASFVYIVYSIHRCINVKFYVRYRMCCSYELTPGIAWGVGGVGVGVEGTILHCLTPLLL